MKKCPRCGYENPDEAPFCEKCRYPLPVTPIMSYKCPRCGYENPEGTALCQKCHYPLFRIPVSEIEQPKREEQIPKIVLTQLDYVILLVGSILTSLGVITFFMFYPDYSVVYTALNVLGTSLLTIPFIKVNKLYVLAIIGSFGMYFLSPTSLIGVLLFSFGGVMVSTALREFYFSVKDNVVQFSSYLLLAGYLFGMFFINLYMLTISGYILLAIYSFQQGIRQKKLKPSPS
ncbi:zinc ribbon domain-containing protein [Stygiolobus caldivivus]|uniref:DZANK-type domain-containing protein n=1 Tax=Stygiolobus caldivivus TaxID=2824673 RepID=A0A8D5U9R7_9CREN|nr:zinc ribbon domain-containing protein [Stygiolobus caldivivus]BCU71468.1 hypothetical protein KN1_27650 [Stygiolobus caldivivus]